MTNMQTFASVIKETIKNRMPVLNNICYPTIDKMQIEISIPLYTQVMSCVE